jgi:GntR family galactonate operon transcriptional repressor
MERAARIRLGYPMADQSRLEAPAPITRTTRQQVRQDKLGARVARMLAGRLIHEGTAGAQAVLPTEREISEEFGVSKTVAREVVAHLLSMKLVETHHGRRMELRPESDWNYLHPMMLELQDEAGARRMISELFDVRLLVEPETAARAAVDASDSQLGQMAHWLDQMRRTLDDPEAYHRHDLAFHQEILAASRNRLLGHILDSVQHLLFQSRRTTGMSSEARKQAYEFHVVVFEAIRDRNPDRARLSMRTHLLAGALGSGITPMAQGLEEPVA